MSEHEEVKRAEWQARAIVGWPNCTCGASDYRYVRDEGPIRWVEPTGVMRPKRQKYCRHRDIALMLLRAYRRGRAAGRATT